jgi:hypothetical protein
MMLTGYPLHSVISPSLSLPYLVMCHLILLGHYTAVKTLKDSQCILHLLFVEVEDMRGLYERPSKNHCKNCEYTDNWGNPADASTILQEHKGDGMKINFA